MNWIPLDSSMLDRIRYDQNSKTLEIEFKGGRVYQYFNVPLHVFEGLRSAVDSHGKYFNAHIKGQYRYDHV